MREFLLFMADDKKKLLNDLEFRVRQVMFLCDTLRGENELLQTKLDATMAQLKMKDQQLEQLTKKYDSLNVARTITAASVEVDVAKEQLSRLVREVDKCINLLNI